MSRPWLNSGEILTENIAILSWISDQSIPALFGDFVRYRLLEALAYFSTEIHKSFKPYFTPGAIWGMSVKLGLGCPLCGHLGHSGVVEADSDHETMGDTISRARLSQPRWNTFKHRCKRDRNPCDRPPPTGAAAKHAEGSLYHFGFSQGLIQKVHNFFI